MAMKTNAPSMTLLDPTGEHRIVQRKKAQRPPALDGKVVGILDIGKLRGDVYLQRVAERFAERGITVQRYLKPGPGTLVSTAVKQKMISDNVASVVIGLAD